MTTAPWETADLNQLGTISEIVKIYEREVENIKRAYTTLEMAGANLTAAFGKETTYSSINTLPRTCHSYKSTMQEVLEELRATCWKNLVARLGIRRVLSLKRNEELSRKLDDAKNLPEITVESVFETFDLMVGNANDFARESIREVFEAFHVRVPTDDYDRRHTLKTNLRNATEDLGKKIIVTGALHSNWGGGYRVEYGRYATDKLRALDKVFHNLDGAPFQESGYISPLIDAIHNCEETSAGETEYFKFKCYGNGNLHLEFKRLDLLKEFNRIANDGTQLKSGRIF